MTGTRYQSWGRYPLCTHTVLPVDGRRVTLPVEWRPGATYLPFGNGRSYGDSCLNDGGVLLDCRGMNRILSFDPAGGLLRCEAGVLFSEILSLIVPNGWFVPVTPGTQYVTLGGAIANDIHGKNHHRAGTIGRHVTRFELLRSDGSRRVCSPSENVALFRATIGGLGLTGVITWAEVQLTPIHNAAIDREVIRFSTLEEFFDLSKRSAASWEHTVAWVDSLASGKSLGRGLFMRGNHAGPKAAAVPPKRHNPKDFPLDPAVTLVNRLTLKAFNTLYYRKQVVRQRRSTVSYQAFFYPLDRIGRWNRLYGRRGLLQHQCVIPRANGADAIRELLAASSRSGTGSFLTVLKEFGDLPSPGLLSFPRPGVTLTLDFPNQGAGTFALLDRLDAIVVDAGGAINPYKDARMSPEAFQRSFPQWRKLEPFMDPLFSSSFWRRVCVAEGNRSTGVQAAQ